MPAEVTLVAVSKGAGTDLLRAAYAAGQRDFAENRAAALAERWGELPGDARWHFIGRLQGNKVRVVRPVACLLHSLDRADLAGYWAKGPGLPPPGAGAGERVRASRARPGCRPARPRP